MNRLVLLAVVTLISTLCSPPASRVDWKYMILFSVRLTTGCWDPAVTQD